MSDIRFRIAAKTDIGLERNNNEDNLQVSANLDEAPMKWVNNQEYSLGNKGALMVVADGMGGMNAGEVASEIAINTVRELFSPEHITDEVVKNRFTIEKFMKGIIVEADKRIKEFGKENPESQGMGTTIVIAWLFDGNLYVSWCGDSRAYIFNENTGLFQISKDHSYVQELVDRGKLSKEEAFDFPDSNIVTRSLTDSNTKAVSDCLLKPQPLCNGDVILLCSDGLNGMIRDNEIEAIISQHQDNMTDCADSLIQAALEAAGADNCTVALCQILSGGADSTSSRVPKSDAPDKNGNSKSTLPSKNSHRIFWMLIAILLLALLGGAWWYLDQRESMTGDNSNSVDSTLIKKEKKDSIAKADSIAKLKKDSLEKVKRDSIEKAKKDSLKEREIKELKKKLGKKESNVIKSIEDQLGMSETKNE